MAQLTYNDLALTTYTDLLTTTYDDLYTAGISGSAALSGAGTLSASGKRVVSGAANLSGSGTLAASWYADKKWSLVLRRGHPRFSGTHIVGAAALRLRGSPPVVHELPREQPPSRAPVMIAASGTRKTAGVAALVGSGALLGLVRIPA